MERPMHVFMELLLSVIRILLVWAKLESGRTPFRARLLQDNQQGSELGAELDISDRLSIYRGFRWLDWLVWLDSSTAKGADNVGLSLATLAYVGKECWHGQRREGLQANRQPHDG